MIEAKRKKEAFQKRAESPFEPEHNFPKQASHANIPQNLPHPNQTNLPNLN